ncbi:MAG TPA: bifunctional diaminohydroxyphosphoribosylaminopyrimidine deaminase/5-amino-6-(5-phosphoribosylamino)uracil reductase RibD [Propylenella sp.]
MDETDRRFTAAAIRLGASALGMTWPNPAVGALVVKSGKVLGRGRTGEGGRPHGEAVALAMAGDAARGADMFVSLEPCSHHGRTPPCTDAIVAAGIARIVATATDPDPRVAGRGFERLRSAGIEVVTGLLADDARRVQAGHFTRIERERPHVLLKLAVSADDAVGRRAEVQVPVTGAIARRHVQALRSRSDAILVGRGTVEADDPQLTCRLPGLGHRSPVRVILDSNGRLGLDRKVFAGTIPTWIFSAEGSGLPAELPAAGAGAAGEGEPSGDSHLRRFTIPRADTGGLDLRVCLQRLAGEGITRLLVEGGARLARSLLEADLADEVMLFRSPEALGGDIVPALAGMDVAEIERSPRFRRAGRRAFGPDVMTRYERLR